MEKFNNAMFVQTTSHHSVDISQYMDTVVFSGEKPSNELLFEELVNAFSFHSGLMNAEKFLSIQKDAIMEGIKNPKKQPIVVIIDSEDTTFTFNFINPEENQGDFVYFCEGLESNKYETHWVSYSIRGTESIEKLRANLNELSKEELVDKLLRKML